ncbi:hypothetical protein M501DRAFT_961215 [Patellaria atrata CBS 101060]|uniref:DUF155 domain-containing protein n=1 Tax=Patellaria atrata CBS 101060 TaxID=1346257 RepID=A0A9P4S604_9PEZI|nr:hypothetical protein M501DRAFT_961215 [Patellaria atrata CBS 101060]
MTYSYNNVTRCALRSSHRPCQLLGFSRSFTRATPSFKTNRERIVSQDVTSKQDDQTKRKGARASAGKTSLRRVAVEAERSRVGFIRGRGKIRFVDPEVETRTVTAYCAAEQYNISKVAHLVKEEGYKLDPYHTGLYPQVVHLRTPYECTQISEHGDAAVQGLGDLFIFPSGTAVAWNVPNRLVSDFVSRILLPAAEGVKLDFIEEEDLEYVEDPSTDASSIIGDTIILGTQLGVTLSKSSENGYVSQSRQGNSENNAVPHDEIDTVLAKIAFSSGLARSTKLAVLESLLNSYFNSTRDIPRLLSHGSRLPYSRDFILRKTGELLSIRAQLNLYSELTDSLPDLFWDSRHELGLEGYYDEVGRALDINVRIKSLNDKMDYAQEIATVLRERLSESHGLLLEWLIIALISVEVLFELLRQYKEWEERHDELSTDALFRKFLKKELQKEQSR